MSAPDNNLKHPSQAAALGAQVAKAVAWVSGLFSLVACIFIIMQQIQSMTIDPLNDPTLKVLKAQIQKDRDNQQLRDTVRNLHLMTRRAFFTNQTQMRSTGWMLLLSVSIFLASMKTYVELRLKLPVPEGQAPREGGSAERSAGRWAVAAGAGLVVLVTLLMVFISPPAMDLVGAQPEGAAVETKSEPAPGPAPSPGAKAEPAPTPKSAEEAKSAPPAAVPKPAAPQTLAKLIPPPAGAWPVFRGPGGLGVATHAKAPLAWCGIPGKEENIAWKVALPKPGTNSPIVWGGKVFVAGSDESSRDIYALDAETGKLLWTGATPLVSGVLPKVMEGTTYCASTLATDGERVYGIFATGDIVAFALDGTKAWSRNLGAIKNSYGHSSSLITVPGRLLVQFDHGTGGHLLALDPASGKTLWDKAREVKESWASPALVDTGSRIEIVLAAKPWVAGHDPMTGDLLWKIECMDGEVAPSPAFAAGRLFVGTQGQPLTAIQTGAQAKQLWQYEGELPDVSSPVATEKYVILAASGGMVTCLNAVTGKMIWTQEFDDGFYASPVVVGERVYLMDRKGKTVVFKLGDKYEQLALNALGEPASSTPAIPEGRIYLRSDKNLYCIGRDAR